MNATILILEVFFCGFALYGAYTMMKNIIKTVKAIFEKERNKDLLK